MRVWYSMRAACSSPDRWWQLSRADSAFHSLWEQTSGGQAARRPSRWTILIRPGEPGNPTPVLCEGSHGKSDERSVVGLTIIVLDFSGTEVRHWTSGQESDIASGHVHPKFQWFSN